MTPGKCWLISLIRTEFRHFTPWVRVWMSPEDLRTSKWWEAVDLETVSWMAEHASSVFFSSWRMMSIRQGSDNACMTAVSGTFFTSGC